MINFAEMDYRKVKGLSCNYCDISSCEHSVMHTPVSKFDAEQKKVDLENLEWNEEDGMYYIKKDLLGKCVYFDTQIKECNLPIEQRFNSCLLFPVRVYSSNDKVKLILNINCPSSITLFDLVARREPSVCRFVKNAAKIFNEDVDYRNHVINKTKEFDKVLLIGNLDDWRDS